MIDKPKQTAAPASEPEITPPLVRLALFIAGSTPRSKRAEANLVAVLKELDDDARLFYVEIIDVFREPRRALKQRVIATPTLLREGHDDRPLIGDLSDLATVRALLQEALQAR